MKVLSHAGHLEVEGLSAPTSQVSFPNRHLPGRSGAGVEDRLSRRVHPLDDQVVQHHLLLGPLDDVLLHRAFGHQTVDIDLRGKAVRWGHRFSEDLWGFGVKGQSHPIMSPAPS